MAASSRASEPTAADEGRQLAIAETELTHELPDVPQQVVHTQVRRAFDSYQDAPIRDFVPLLVRRHVRDQLREHPQR